MKNTNSLRLSCLQNRGQSFAAFSLIELLVVIAIIGLLAGLLAPTLARAKSKARNAACASQLRQLGIATRLYADDHDRVLPAAEILPSMPVNPALPRPRICDVLAEYVGKAAGGTNSALIFKCPSDNVGRYTSEGSSYEWNIELNGHRIDETTTGNVVFDLHLVGPGGEIHTNGAVQLTWPPETTPLLLDYEEFHPRPPRSGKNVVFMDDHVAPLESFL